MGRVAIFFYRLIAQQTIELILMRFLANGWQDLSARVHQHVKLKSCVSVKETNDRIIGNHIKAGSQYIYPPAHGASPGGHFQKTSFLVFQ